MSMTDREIQTLSNLGHEDAAEEIQLLRAEINRLQSALRYEQHLSERIVTHGPGCELWGPAHYECAVRELASSREREARMRDAERYRWLREHFRFANDSMRELWFDPVLEPNDSGVPDDLDQEIDHAMSGANAEVSRGPSGPSA